MMRLNRYLPAFLLGQRVAASGVNQGLPAVYIGQFVGPDSLFYVGDTPALEFTIREQRGGTVPVPSAIAFSILDNNGAALITPKVSSKPYCDASVPAALITVGCSDIVFDTSGSYKVQARVTLNDGTGAQVRTFRQAIRVVT